MTHALSSTSLLLAAEHIAALAAKHAAEAEARRLIDSDVAALVIEAGFARHFVPTRFGGSAGTFAELLAAVAEIGEGCASTAWFASLAASVGRMAAYLPEAGRRAIWARCPDTIVVGALVPSGEARPVPGGWRVSGRWTYVSGVDLSSWALVCARTATAEGGQEPRFFAVPREAYRTVDTWFNTGMRATGSNTLLLDEVTVPKDHSVALDTLLAGLAPDAEAPCHRTPMKAANGLTLTAPLLGAARGARNRWTELTEAKLQGPGGAISGGADRTAAELVLARADGQIDAARLLLERVASVSDSGAVTALDTVRNGRDCALAADLLATTVDTLLRTSGSRGQAESEDLQRFWRDVNSGAGHSGLQFAPAASAYARSLLTPAAD
ncbi:acyl-CoA dehydrogenase family protein [Streptomyces gobiensis]|uniref:acyl-CoA dehydrogenase family protein n=1 Tax=Streptomyces gobiensis TaxID=2875706 RepID=UPI001E341617|nr:acyl-CoA dehydrogenase family protein [Streptomyces gobiensis]UGY93002.1 acyl-CoA dehydrogenase family protein [Streptomyces gobiensis]